MSCGNCSTHMLNLIDSTGGVPFIRIVQVTQSTGTVKIQVIGDFTATGDAEYTVVGTAGPTSENSS